MHGDLSKGSTALACSYASVERDIMVMMKILVFYRKCNRRLGVFYSEKEQDKSSDFSNNHTTAAANKARICYNSGKF